MSDTGDGRWEFPPVVYAPTTTLPGDDARRLELVGTTDGRTALFVYSAVGAVLATYRLGGARADAGRWGLPHRRQT